MKSTSAQNHEQSILHLAQAGGFLRAGDLLKKNIPTNTLTRMVAAGKLERVSRGVYCLPDQAISEQRSLAEAALRVPQGVICLLSALQFHEIGTQAPFEVWLAMPNTLATPKLDHPAIRAVRMSDAALNAGKDIVTIDGVPVPIFNAAKTIADCFKYRNKIGLDVALEALREAWHEQKVSIDSLWHYATINRVANVMRPYLEAITA
jgi:predicted transcriptional regulator of viral defense system